MKLIHTADIHLDASFGEAGLPPEAGHRRREAIRATLRGLLARAAAWPADAVLVAGDLFELRRVTRDTVAFLRESFESIRPIPVFIAPGNQDPYVAHSPYVTEPWPANVFLFDSPAWTSHALGHAPLTIHGMAHTGGEGSESVMGRLEPASDGRVHVAVAHGAEREHVPPGQKLVTPFRCVDVTGPGLTYLALGHYHRPIEIAGAPGTGAWYPGVLEPLGFDTPGRGHFIEVEIAEDGPVEVRVVPCGEGQFIERALDCEGIEDEAALTEALRSIAAELACPAFARVRLRGAAVAGLSHAVSSARAAAAPAYLHLDVVDETEFAEDYVELARQNTSLGAFVRRLQSEIGDATTERRRAMLVRARDVGVAACHGVELPVRGVEAEG